MDNLQDRVREATSTASVAPLLPLARHVMRTALRAWLGVVMLCVTWAGGVASRLSHRAVQPLQPLVQEVQKVPPKDVSAQGIFYQGLRLCVLVVMYLTPYGVRALRYMATPLYRVHDWAVMYVKEGVKEE